MDARKRNKNGGTEEENGEKMERKRTAGGARKEEAQVPEWKRGKCAGVKGSMRCQDGRIHDV